MGWAYNPLWAHVVPHRYKVEVAHGFIMGFAFAVLFPLGAILIRTASFRGLVVRPLSKFSLLSRDYLSSLETYCSIGLIWPPSPFQEFPLLKTLSTQATLTQKRYSGSMLQYRFLPTLWHWQVSVWAYILPYILSNWFVDYYRSNIQLTSRS